MSTGSEIIARRKPRKKSLWLILDGDSTVELDLLRNELTNLRLQERINGKSESLGTKIPGLERQIQELEAEIIGNAVEFHFQAIGRRRLQELKNEFPPSEAQWIEYREVRQIDPTVQPPTFDDKAIMPKLIAECTYDAGYEDKAFTVPEATLLWDDLSDGEAAQIQQAVWEVNGEAAVVPLSGSGIGGIGTSDVISTLRQIGESLGQPSTDG